MQEIIDQIKEVKNSRNIFYSLSDEKINEALYRIASNLRDNANQILRENLNDLALMSKENPKYERLELSKDKILDIARDVEKVAQLPSPLNKILEQKVMPNGLIIVKKTVPLGVVAVIYESRPNVSIDVFTLCFKSGNSCILKGGKEAEHSNKILVQIIKESLISCNINHQIVQLLPNQSDTVETLLNAIGLIDVCIPRGSQGLINFVRSNSKIPVIETGAGVVHIYFDQSGDKEKAQKIINNAKTRRVSVCNALDCLLIHKNRLEDLAYLIIPLAQAKVEILADEECYNQLLEKYPSSLLRRAQKQDFGQEFLSYKISIKSVNSLAEAIEHISNNTSHHSESIIAEDPMTIDFFLKNVDAAVVYANTSTSFTDGGEFGLGSEIGISTQKLHARGPMGLEALTSYKWLVYGNGQIR